MFLHFYIICFAFVSSIVLQLFYVLEIRFTYSQLHVSMVKEQRECGNLATPSLGSLLCSDNHIHWNDVAVRLKSCKILCQRGYEYPQGDDSLYYCMSDVGNWFSYPSKEMIKIQDCVESETNTTLDEIFVMKLLENFTNNVISGNINLTHQILNIKYVNTTVLKPVQNITEIKPSGKTEIYSEVQKETTDKPKEYYVINIPKKIPLNPDNKANLKENASHKNIEQITDLLIKPNISLEKPKQEPFEYIFEMLGSKGLTNISMEQSEEETYPSISEPIKYSYSSMVENNLNPSIMGAKEYMNLPKIQSNEYAQSPNLEFKYNTYASRIEPNTYMYPSTIKYQENSYQPILATDSKNLDNQYFKQTWGDYIVPPASSSSSLINSNNQIYTVLSPEKELWNDADGYYTPKTDENSHTKDDPWKYLEFKNNQYDPKKTNINEKNHNLADYYALNEWKRDGYRAFQLDNRFSLNDSRNSLNDSFVKVNQEVPKKENSKYRIAKNINNYDPSNEIQPKTSRKISNSPKKNTNSYSEHGLRHKSIQLRSENKNEKRQKELKMAKNEKLPFYTLPFRR